MPSILETVCYTLFKRSKMLRQAAEAALDKLYEEHIAEQYDAEKYREEEAPKSGIKLAGWDRSDPWDFDIRS